jgi:hypothetical protein
MRDPDPSVRLAAAGALGTAQVKGRAVRALVLTLAEAVNSTPLDAPLIGAIHRALVKQSGERVVDEATPKVLCQEWMDWWKKNQTELEETDRRQMERLQAAPKAAEAKTTDPAPRPPAPPPKDFPREP